MHVIKFLLYNIEHREGERERERVRFKHKLMYRPNYLFIYILWGDI